jgi:trans-aconitate methyltransferase
MTLKEAIAFLSKSLDEQARDQTWADLGCGSGLFTRALSARLAPGSTIFAVDQVQEFEVSDTDTKVNIELVEADFISEELPFDRLDGILMANALHYVPDKKNFLEKALAYLASKGKWIIVEYETVRANRWVPYPVNFEQLKALFAGAGVKNIRKTAERPSVYQGAMYTAVITL